MHAIVIASLLSFAASPALQEVEEPAALRALDPVELCRGSEVPGRAELALEHHLYRYRFSSEATLAEFRQDPARYEIQLGGGCGRMGPLSGLGDPARFAVWDGRIYIFASDSCRQGFLSDPEAHLDRDDPVSDATPEQVARGAQLVALALEGLGGAERVDAAQSLVALHEERSEYQGREVVSGKCWRISWPDRIRYESFWDTSRTVRVVAPEGGFTAREESSEGGFTARVESPEGGFTARDENVDPLHRSQRALLEKEAGRFVLSILKSRGRPDFLAVARGAAEVEGRPVEQVAVSSGGATSLLSVDPESGRVLRQEHVARPGIGPNGTLVLSYSDFREIGGLVLPFTREVTWNGKPQPNLSFTWTALRAGEPLDEGLFGRPRGK